MATILVVDDDPAVLRLVAAVLEKTGHKIMRAANGVEALMVYQSYAQRIDLVLTDVDMPQMNGLALAARIRGSRPSARIILMTGALPAGTPVASLPCPVLTKPFRPADLLAAVQEAVGGT